jgi:hypothetical protein
MCAHGKGHTDSPSIRVEPLCLTNSTGDVNDSPAKSFIYEALKAGRESDEPATDFTAPTIRKPGG